MGRIDPIGPTGPPCQARFLLLLLDCRANNWTVETWGRPLSPIFLGRGFLAPRLCFLYRRRSMRRATSTGILAKASTAKAPRVAKVGSGTAISIPGVTRATSSAARRRPRRASVFLRGAARLMAQLPRGTPGTGTPRLIPEPWPPPFAEAPPAPLIAARGQGCSAVLPKKALAPPRKDLPLKGSPVRGIASLVPRSADPRLLKRLPLRGTSA
jgi:hypothetical protein